MVYYCCLVKYDCARICVHDHVGTVYMCTLSCIQIKVMNIGNLLCYRVSATVVNSFSGPSNVGCHLTADRTHYSIVVVLQLLWCVWMVVV